MTEPASPGGPTRGRVTPRPSFDPLPPPDDAAQEKPKTPSPGPERPTSKNRLMDQPDLSDKDDEDPFLSVHPFCCPIFPTWEDTPIPGLPREFATNKNFYCHHILTVKENITRLTDSLKVLIRSHPDSQVTGTLLRKASVSLNRHLQFPDKGKITCFYTEEGVTPRPRRRMRSLRGYIRPPLPHSPDMSHSIPTQPPVPPQEHKPAKHSTLKLEFLPVTTSGRTTSPEDILGALSSLKDFDLSRVLDPIRLTPHPRHKTCVTAVFKVLDHSDGPTTCDIVGRRVSIQGEQRQIRTWLDKPNTPQCNQCYKWGHHSHNCRTRGAYCAICGGTHPTSLHCMICLTHNTNSSPCPALHDLKCINCGGQHDARSRDCIWYQAHTNETAMRSLMGQRRQRLIHAHLLRRNERLSARSLRESTSKDHIRSEREHPEPHPQNKGRGHTETQDTHNSGSPTNNHEWLNYVPDRVRDPILTRTNWQMTAPPSPGGSFEFDDVGDSEWGTDVASN